MEKWWRQQSWEMRENQGYLKTRQTHQIPRGNLEQEWRKISDGNVMHSSHAVKPKSKRALRNPLNYLVAISLQELPKRSHSEPESGSNNPERVLRYRQATKNQEQRLCSGETPDRSRVSKEMQEIPSQRHCPGPSQKPEEPKERLQAETSALLFHCITSMDHLSLTWCLHGTTFKHHAYPLRL